MSSVRVSPVTSPKRERGGWAKDEDEETNFSYSPLSSAVASPSKSNMNELYTGSPSSQGSRGSKRSTDSTLRDPPPPYSSPSKTVASHNSSSRYSSLMQFLDKEIESTSTPSSRTNHGGNRNGHGLDDNVTTVSTVSDLSPNSKSRPDDARSFGSKSLYAGRSYIWDDDMAAYGGKGQREDSTSAGNGDNNGDAATYFSSQTMDATSFGSSKDLQETVSKIKQQVEQKKSELVELTRKAKDLQSELVRVNAARKRRVTKVRSEWEQKLEKQREESDVSLKRMKEFAERLQKETDELKKKRDSLQEKEDKIVKSRDQTLQLLREDIERKAAQTRRQWQVEEKAVFDKALSQRMDGIKKQAAEAFGPQMDKMVQDGKLALRKREEEINGRLEQARIHLQSELDRKLAAAKDAMREQIRNEEDRARRRSERKLEEALRAQSEEMAAVKTKFQRDKKVLEENVERVRRLNAESILESMKEVRTAESKQVMELMAANQRELAQIGRNNTEALRKEEERLSREEQEHLKAVAERLDKEVSAKKEQALMSAKTQAGAETERVLERLREDVQMERRRVKERIDKELDDLRLSTHTALEAKASQEKRMMERIAAMKGEVESFRRELSSLEDRTRDKKSDLADAKTRLSALRTELRQVEEEVDNTELRCNEELIQHQRKSSREYQQLLDEENSLKEELHREEVAAANRKDDAIAMYAADLTRIRDKVEALLKRKDDTARSLRQQLAGLQEKSSHLEEQRDTVRAEQYARLATSVDGEGSNDNDGTRDIFSRLNIGNIDPESGQRTRGGSSTSSTSSRSTTSRTAAGSRRDKQEYSFRV